MRSQVEYISIDSERAGQRIDNFLLHRFKGVPKSRVYRLLRRGEVRVNKSRVQAVYRLQKGDIVRLPPVNLPANLPPAVPSESLCQHLQQAILYEDKYLLVVDKPAGLAVHGGSGIKLGLIEALRALYQSTSLELVHRLDRETSGCVMVAKKRSTLRYLHEQLRKNAIKKHYTALAIGRWPAQCQSVVAPLLKNTLQSGERIVRVAPQGKPSTTRFNVVSSYAQATLLDVQPITGRTHQIRVHAQYIGHPLLGDTKYDNDAARRYATNLGLRRLFLHASRLHLTHSHTGEQLVIEAPLSADLQGILHRLV